MSELRKALETIAAHPINDIITAETWRLIVEDMQTLARAALSNEEAGEAALAPVAWRVKDFADGWVLFDTESAALIAGKASGAIVQPLYTSPRIRRVERQPIAIVDGTDEPPNAILAGVIPDAGRRDEATALARELVRTYAGPLPRTMQAELVTQFASALLSFREEAPNARMGRHADIILEALNSYDEFMHDDDYDPWRFLRETMATMRDRYNAGAALREAGRAELVERED